MKSTFIFVLSYLFVSHSFAQKNKINILRNFDHIEYYPDSTIRLAMNYDSLELVGFCIEFDSLGNPISIGEYRAWKRIGIWLNADGTMTSYIENQKPNFKNTGCVTERYYTILQFKELYEALTR